MKTERLFKVVLAIAISGLMGCTLERSGSADFPPLGVPSEDGTVIKSRAIIPIDNAGFATRDVSNALLDFGLLTMDGLNDNDLDLCGATSDQHCGQAFIRVYTTGTPMSGLYNAVSNYSLPITANHNGGAHAAVGLDPAGALYLKSIAIPANKHTVLLSDFASPDYGLEIDFSNAGAGTFATTLVIEYVLAD